MPRNEDFFDSRQAADLLGFCQKNLLWNLLAVTRGLTHIVESGANPDDFFVFATDVGVFALERCAAYAAAN